MRVSSGAPLTRSACWRHQPRIIKPCNRLVVLAYKAKNDADNELPSSKSGLRRLKKADLQQELELRGADTSGNKDELVSRLMELMDGPVQAEGAVADADIAADEQMNGDNGSNVVASTRRDRRSHASADDPATDDGELRRVSADEFVKKLEALPKADLVRACDELGLGTSGSKQLLIKRVLNMADANFEDLAFALSNILDLPYDELVTTSQRRVTSGVDVDADDIDGPAMAAQTRGTATARVRSREQSAARAANEDDEDSISSSRRVFDGMEDYDGDDAVDDDGDVDNEQEIEEELSAWYKSELGDEAWARAAERRAADVGDDSEYLLELELPEDAPMDGGAARGYLRAVMEDIDEQLDDVQRETARVPGSQNMLGVDDDDFASADADRVERALREDYGVITDDEPPFEVGLVAGLGDLHLAIEGESEWESIDEELLRGLDDSTITVDDDEDVRARASLRGIREPVVPPKTPDMQDSLAESSIDDVDDADVDTATSPVERGDDDALDTTLMSRRARVVAHDRGEDRARSILRTPARSHEFDENVAGEDAGTATGSARGRRHKGRPARSKRTTQAAEETDAAALEPYDDTITSRATAALDARTPQQSVASNSAADVTSNQQPTSATAMDAPSSSDASMPTLRPVLQTTAALRDRASSTAVEPRGGSVPVAEHGQPTNTTMSSMPTTTAPAGLSSVAAPAANLDDMPQPFYEVTYETEEEGSWRVGDDTRAYTSDGDETARGYGDDMASIMAQLHTEARSGLLEHLPDDASSLVSPTSDDESSSLPSTRSDATPLPPWQPVESNSGEDQHYLSAAAANDDFFDRGSDERSASPPPVAAAASDQRVSSSLSAAAVTPVTPIPLVSADASANARAASRDDSLDRNVRGANETAHRDDDAVVDGKQALTDDVGGATKPPAVIAVESGALLDSTSTTAAASLAAADVAGRATADESVTAEPSSRAAFGASKESNVLDSGAEPSAPVSQTGTEDDDALTAMSTSSSAGSNQAASRTADGQVSREATAAPNESPASKPNEAGGFMKWFDAGKSWLQKQRQGQ